MSALVTPLAVRPAQPPDDVEALEFQCHTVEALLRALDACIEQSRIGRALVAESGSPLRVVAERARPASGQLPPPMPLSADPAA